MRPGSTAALAIVVLLAAPSAAAPEAPKPTPDALEGMPLVFRPSDDTGQLSYLASHLLSDRKVSLAPFVDGRDAARKALIGRHSYRNGESIVTTKDDVAAFCAAQLDMILKRGDVQVVSSGADLTVTGTLKQFMVEEGQEHWNHNVYNGVVELEVVVLDAAQKELWRGSVVGMSDDTGESYRATNHQQGFSDALVKAYDALFRNQRLREALASRSK
jgi:hypothetical protein